MRASCSCVAHRGVDLDRRRRVDSRPARAPHKLATTCPTAMSAQARFVGATIAAKSMLASARVVARSFKDHHPDTPFFVLLSDEIDGCFDPAQEPFELVFLRDLDIPEPARFRFSHPQQRLSYAATPFLIAKLFDLGYDRVVFIKQESLVLGDLRDTVATLPPGGIALTPHLLAPVDSDDAVERELTILLSGVFNGGFVGIAAGDVSRRFLDWWQERVYSHCLYEVGDGMHYEQRWLDHVAAYFETVHVLHDPGLNVGHWNLPERRITLVNGMVRANDHPCRLFRFSGYDPGRPEAATTYSPRLKTSALADAAIVFDRYRNALLDAGWAETRNWPYAYGYFSNGVVIPDVARAIYAGQEAVERFADPFETEGSTSFFRWLRGPAANRKGLSRLWLGVYELRPDLQHAYPDVFGRHRAAFNHWTRSAGIADYGVPEALL